MVNFNGTIIPDHIASLVGNRGFSYGDGVFETLRVLDGRILFFEDHYFRLMSSMRIIRMEIPMRFTMEYLSEQILLLTDKLNLSGSARVRMDVFRNGGGFYLPETRTASFMIQAVALPEKLYAVSKAAYEVDLYRDFYVARQLLSSVKSTNRVLNVTAAIYAAENGLQNCLLLNDAKNVCEAIQGNLFMRTGNRLVTPPLSEGCVNGIMRKKVLEIARKKEGLEVVEEVVSPFDLQKADELFVTNVIRGLQPITQYRKASYGASLATELTVQLNAELRLS